MTSLDLKPLANHVLVSIPERYHAPDGPRSPDGLGITLMSGEDCMKELEAAIRNGTTMQIETETDRSIKNLVRVGQVLQVPSRLDNTMTLCAGGPKGYRTFADIVPTVEVGDTVFLDVSALIPDNDGTNPNELMPGIYRLPYSAVICELWSLCADDLLDLITPVGGYVLLSRVWPADVVDEPGEFGLVKCRKNADGLVIETAVKPLANEGLVRWVGEPLKGSLDEIREGQRVIIAPGQGLVETIAGTEYLCVRQDYVLAVREPITSPTHWFDQVFEGGAGHVTVTGKELTYSMADVKKGYEYRKALEANYPNHLPLAHPSYLA